jgi:aminoglycoside 3'-phosphotransferase-2
MRLDRLLSMAHEHLAAGLVDEDDFDSSRAGRTASDLWDELLDRRPSAEDLVVVHGDFCLPNVVAQNDAISGFLDLGRAGIGDRYLDLALATRSLVGNGHGDAVAAFYEAYGLADVDEEKIEFYRLLDEFF